VKLSRKQLQEAAETMPIEAILGRQAAGQLTAKQRKFAHEIARGATKADAYRAAYDVTSRRTMSSEPYRLADDPRITREIEAYELAIEAAKHRTPAALRELVIQSLVKVIVDPESKPGQITAAAKVLGTVTEVAAFTERKEVRTISSSEDARARVMQELRGLITLGASDATVIEADSLLAELAGEGAKTSATDAAAKTSAPEDASRTLESEAPEAPRLDDGRE